MHSISTLDVICCVIVSFVLLLHVWFCFVTVSLFSTDLRDWLEDCLRHNPCRVELSLLLTCSFIKVSNLPKLF